MEPWKRLTHRARSQHGLVTLAQAVELGLDARTVQRHAQRAGWERPQRGVYALPGSTRTYQRDVMAMLLAAGERSAASHEVAASLAGLQRAQPRPLSVVVPRDRKAPNLKGVRGHRSSTLKTVDIVTAEGLRFTAVSRTLCDLATLEERRLRELTAVALQSGLTTIERIESTSNRLGTHAGVGRLRDVLEQLRGTSSDSAFERRAREWLSDEGLPPHPCLYPVRAEDDVVCELDIAYPDEMTFVDCLGFPFHSLPDDLSLDSVRGNGITAAGWLGLKLDESQLEARSPVFLRQLRSTLLRRRGYAARWAAQHATAPVPAPRGWA